MLKELLKWWISRQSQNSCYSFEGFTPQINDGLCFLIIGASLKSSTFQVSNPTKDNAVIFYLQYADIIATKITAVNFE